MRIKLIVSQISYPSLSWLRNYIGGRIAKVQKSYFFQRWCRVYSDYFYASFCIWMAPWSTVLSGKQLVAN
jgi:hypothetical protein